MTESRSNYTVLDCSSALTHSESFQKQYCSFTQYQVIPPVSVTQPVTQLSETMPFKV